MFRHYPDRTRRSRQSISRLCRCRAEFIPIRLEAQRLSLFPAAIPARLRTTSRQSRLLFFHQSRIVSRKRLSPVESALTINAPITRLESALPKTQHLKPFRIRTYEKTQGGGGKLLTRHPTKGVCPSDHRERGTSPLCRSRATALLNLQTFQPSNISTLLFGYSLLTTH